MKSIKALRDEYSQKANDPNNRSHEWCVAEARRLAQTREWTRGIPQDWIATTTSRSYQPGDEVLPTAVASSTGAPRRYRYYFVGSMHHGSSSMNQLLRSDGTLTRSAGITRALATPTVRAYNDGLVVKIAQQIITNNAWNQTPLLADALEEAGCVDMELLSLLRHSPPPPGDRMGHTEEEWDRWRELPNRERDRIRNEEDEAREAHQPLRRAVENIADHRRPRRPW